MSLQNQVAIVTGGSSGIGRATVDKFARAGAIVYIWDIDEDAGMDIVAKLQEENLKVFFQRVNNTRPDEVENAAKLVHGKEGKIYILINNAGITRDATLKKMTAEQWNSVIAVNLTGVFNCTQIVAAYMYEKGYGRIVTASSVVGVYGNFGQTNYAATKAGVIGMTKVWSRELGRKGITANAVVPGFIETEMMATIPEKVLDMMREKTPVGRLGTPEEVANAYLFLASKEAGFINGSVLHIDGGVSL